ncbi:hypothetical protein PINS_up010359 [Pythium insidiosum]|nr:hypothetical protein PINS_up010359 [Pythium insidiosum]
MRRPPSTEDARSRGISASRWAFLERPWYQDWVSAVQPQVGAPRGRTPVLCRPQFRHFSLYLPWNLSAVDAERIAQLRDATELSGLMLKADPETWRFLKAAYRPWFRAFHLLEMDALEPRMDIVMGQRWGMGLEQFGSLRNCRAFLLGEQSRDAMFLKARQQIISMDTCGRLRSPSVFFSLCADLVHAYNFLQPLCFLFAMRGPRPRLQHPKCKS